MPLAADRRNRPFLVGCALLLLLGVGVNAPFFAYDAVEQDVYYTWLEGNRILHGENPYSRVHGSDMRVNDKYATYFPGFYLLAAAVQAAGLEDFDDWVLFWRPVFLACNVAIAILLFSAGWRRGAPWFGAFAAVFWLCNRWTLYTSRVAHIEFVPVLLLLLSLLVFPTRRRTSLLLLGGSLAIKQLAIFLLPLYVIWGWRRDDPRRWRSAAYAIGWIALIPLLLSVPFLVWDPTGFVKSILFSATRAPDGHVKGLHSLDALIGMRVPAFVGVPAKLPMALAMGLVWAAAARRELGIATGALLAFLVFLGFNSVLFMQYFCWALPLIPLALLERRAVAPAPS